jgi:hypothetical protein
MFPIVRTTGDLGWIVTGRMLRIRQPSGVLTMI